MNYYGRRNFGDFYRGQFNPYWLPRRHYQSSQPAILVVQVPVPVTLKNNKFDQPNVMHNSKSRATLTRDGLRMQRFCDNKNMCSALPFAHLDDTQMKEVISIQSDFQPNSRKSKFKSASKRIKHLKGSFNLLNSTIQLLYKGREDDCERVQELVKLHDEKVSKLNKELGNEKKTVHKFVAQNVERQREIVKLKRELAQSTTLHAQEINVRKG